MFLKKRNEVSYQPWKKDDWEKIYKESELRLDKERVYILAQYLNRSLSIDGDVIEMGVYRGCTAYVMASMIKKGVDTDKKKLYLCDTFNGTPETYDKSKGDIKRKGKYSDTSKEYVENKIKNVYQKTETVVGFIPDSLQSLENKKFCFAHIHLNLYQSTMDALLWLRNKINHSGVIIIEDYGIANCEGVRKAVDEFALENKKNIIYLPTGQAIIEII